MQKEMTTFRTIREVAEIIDVPQHVLRFWETRFPEVKPLKQNGGRRYYTAEDIQLLQGIRHLLYKEGYTIRGVQRVLREEGAHTVRHAEYSNPEPLKQEAVLPPSKQSQENASSFSSKAHESIPVNRTHENEAPAPISLPLPSYESLKDQGISLSSPQHHDHHAHNNPSLPQISLLHSKLSLNSPPDPTLHMKMGVFSHGTSLSQNENFLRGQLHEALDHLKECRRLLEHAQTLRRTFPLKSS
jgi:DNA-binding transcriptional MerR regulator